MPFHVIVHHSSGLADCRSCSQDISFEILKYNLAVGLHSRVYWNGIWIFFNVRDKLMCKLIHIL
jgi:hypothetical protein